MHHLLEEAKKEFPTKQAQQRTAVNRNMTGNECYESIRTDKYRQFRANPLHGADGKARMEENKRWVREMGLAVRRCTMVAMLTKGRGGWNP